MKHDFTNGNRCRWCGQNIYLADEECSSNRDNDPREEPEYWEDR